MIVCATALLLVGAVAGQETARKPRRTVTALPRYMTDIPQPIPDQIKVPGAPKTTREVECFDGFTSASSMVDVVRKCGIPDEHQGSGIFIFLYDMSDGSVVAIGTPDLKRLIYIDHIEKKGGTRLLQSARPDQVVSRRASSRGAHPTRYFKEDHLTGADYIALAPEGLYKIIGREHVGVFANESGRWSESGETIAFTPDKKGKSPYTATQISYRDHTFLALQDDFGPSIVVPIGEIERNLDNDPNSLPLYVFFEISAALYQKETNQPYPFRTFPHRH